MNGTVPWHCAALLGAVALIMGCQPDSGANQNRAGDSSSARDEANPAATADRDNGPSIRPPTTTTSPAAPVGDTTTRGVVEFQTAAGETGPLTIHVMLMGLEAGPHGMHVHMGTDCADPGEHLNPQNAPHGPANAASGARHLGDLGNVTADASGMVEEMLRDAMLATDSSFVGKTLVVHKSQDDLTTQPGGDSGDPIACGVIEPAEAVISRSGDQDRGV
jgi:Cu-Zn family superoxide dismutase